MKYILSWVIGLCLVFSLAGQGIISGRVLDVSTNEPLVGATILIANSSAGTVSDELGQFDLVTNAQEPEVIVSYVGYLPNYRKVKAGRSAVIHMYPEIRDLETVTVISKEDKVWKRSFRKFSREFFGATEDARACEITNPWIIEFDKLGGTLIAQSDELIHFVNRTTGYEVSIMLEHFAVRGERVVYSGKPGFRELKGDYSKERELTFYGSKRHFFHALTHGVAKEEGYRVFKAKYQPTSNEFEKLNEVYLEDEITQTGNGYLLRLDGYYNVVYTRELDPEMRFSASLTNLGTAQNSFFKAVGDSLLIDDFGNIVNTRNLIEYGYWSEYERMAHLLPQDYFPDEYVKAIAAKARATFAQSQIPRKNGFLLTDLLIPLDEIKFGGPTRDGIPSIDEPKFQSARQTSLDDNARIMGVNMDGVARAYPIAILNWHELVNDQIDGHPILVTYCPLCGSGVVFDTQMDGERRLFGVSGLLYNSDVLLYDRKTESLWSQLEAMAVTGTASGTELTTIPSRTMSWGQWRKMYPDTEVLSEETRFMRDYDRNPYEGYNQIDDIMFPVSNSSDRFPPKETVLGVSLRGEYKAYPLSQFPKNRGMIVDMFNNEVVQVHYDKSTETAWLSDESEAKMESTLLYWFAWYAFHPKTEVYKP